MLSVTYKPGTSPRQILKEARGVALAKIEELEALEVEDGQDVVFNRSSCLAAALGGDGFLVTELVHATRLMHFPEKADLGLVDGEGNPFEVVSIREAHLLVLMKQRQILSVIDLELSRL